MCNVHLAYNNMNVCIERRIYFKTCKSLQFRVPDPIDYYVYVKCCYPWLYGWLFYGQKSVIFFFAFTFCGCRKTWYAIRSAYGILDTQWHSAGVFISRLEFCVQTGFFQAFRVCRMNFSYEIDLLENCIWFVIISNQLQATCIINLRKHQKKATLLQIVH